MTIMGIDPSINCTGVCIHNTIDNTNIYYMIVSKCTKKMLAFKNDHVIIYSYNKLEYTKDDYMTKERKKTSNFNQICVILKDIIDHHEPDLIQIEGISYGSKGSSALVDLAGLNYAIRMTVVEKDIQYNILPPTVVKKFAVGNGGAEKDVMIASWKKLDKNISDVTEIKLDDLADSFFIAHFQ